jgi:hypothetical protein
METLLNHYWLLAFAIVGMLTHTMKKKVTGESFIDIKNYFTHNVKSTFIALVSTLVGFVIYITQLQTGTLADVGIVFGIGYMSDSFFNRYAEA